MHQNYGERCTMQRKQEQSEPADRADVTADEMRRARLPGQDRRVQRKRQESEPGRSRVRNPLRRSRSDY